MGGQAIAGTILFSLVLAFLFCAYMIRCLGSVKSIRNKARCSEGRITTTTTPVSLLEVKVTLPTEVIFGDKTGLKMYDPPELALIPKTRLGEGTMGSLFKVVLDCGSIVTIRRIRSELVDPDDLKLWINFFGGIHDPWLLRILFSFRYGGEAFALYDYFCLGSLEELLHGSEGIQFSPLNCGVRKHIALCAAKAVAFIHTQMTKTGEKLVCGVIKSSNILIRTDFSACLSSYETPYLVSPALLIRRNPSRVAPELKHAQNSLKKFTQKSDVYSFGVLLLELVMGQRPSTTNLREYVLEKRKTEGFSGIYDKRMGEVKENMVGMAGIAQLCLSHNPKDRPSMDKVVQMIQALQD